MRTVAEFIDAEAELADAIAKGQTGRERAIRNVMARWVEDVREVEGV